MKKVLMTATVPSMIGQFNMSNIKILQDLGYQVHVACNFKDTSVWTKERVKQFLDEVKEKDVVCHQVDFARSPLGIKNDIFSVKQMDRLFKQNDFSFVHCHTPVAGVITRIIAHKHKVKAIYTAHGFHFYDGAPKKNWIIFYPIEKFFSRWTDVLITINKEDFNRASTKFNAKKTIYVPGVGVDCKKIASSFVDKSKKRSELGCTDDDFILLSVGELSERKNQKIIIQAISKLKNYKIKYLLVGMGAMKHEFETLAKELGVEDKVIFLGYRTDVNEVLSVADLFVFPSLQEGLPVALMEAMAAGKVILCSRIRGNVDLIDEGKGGYLVQPMDANSFSEKIKKIIYNNSNSKVGKYNKEKISNFDISIINKRMWQVYNSINL